MEDAVVERLGQEAAHDAVGQGILVEAGQGFQRRVGHRPAIGPFQRQHPLAHPVPDDGGGGHIAVLGHDLGQFGGGGGFQPHVQFQRQGAGDDLDKGLGLQPPGGRDEAVDQPGAQTHGVQPLRDLSLYAGAQNLDRHLATVGQTRGVGLCQRRCAHCRTKFRVQTIDRTPDGALDLAARLLDREGRQLVFQVAEVLCELKAKNIGARGQNLTQFDRHRTQLLAGGTDALAGTARLQLAAGEGLNQRRERTAPWRQQVIGLTRNQGVVARQNPPPLHQPKGRTHRRLDPHGLGFGRRGLEGQPAQSAHPWWMAVTPPVRLVTLTRLKPASSIMPLKVFWSGKRRIDSTRYW